MKKIIVSIFCIALAAGSLACIKRSQKSVVSSQSSAVSTQPSNTNTNTDTNTNNDNNKSNNNNSRRSAPAAIGYFFVEDSTGALIPKADITFLPDSQTVTTGWDGRFIVTSDRLADSPQVLVTARGYDTLFTTLTQNSPRVLLLKQRNFIYDDGYADLAREEEVAYSTSAKVRGLGTAKMASKAVFDAEPVPSPRMSIETDEAAVEEYSSPMETPKLTGATNNAVNAGKLTAGEVNDFAKWHLWNKVIYQSHKQFVDTWKIYTDKRYVAQVTNKKGFPVSDMQVRLTDSRGNTLFSAITDNTGRAELWLCCDKNARNERVMIQAGDVRQVAKCFAEGINQFVFDEECFVPSVADVFFIFDATGSMGDELRYLQAEMKDVIQRSQSAVEGLKIRTGALVYRDHHDEYLTRISRLCDDIQTTQNFIDAQSAGGGGDYEEAIPEALMASVNAADWSTEARARIAFLILDAPCHNDSATVQLMRQQAINAAAMGIRIVPVVCSGIQESGELLMRSLALVTNGTSFFLTDDSGIGHTHLKPTTDSLKVEHLNDMMVRTIISFTRMPDCDVSDWAEDAKENEEIEQFLPTPFSSDDLDSVPDLLPIETLDAVLKVRPNPCVEYCLVDLPKGADAVYLCDVSGKTIRSLGKQETGTANLQVDMNYLSTGVYFIKAFYGGRWYSAKLIKA